MRTLAVISAGLSTPSSTRQIADSISEAVTAAVSARGEALSVSTIELSELIPDLMTAMTTGVHTTKLEEITSVLSAADGLVVATPVFKASYTGLFKMFFDVLDTDALTGMPTIIAATAGSARHSLVLDYALRPLLSYMRAVVVPTRVFAATEDFGGPEGAEFNKRIARAAGELASLIVEESGNVGGLGGVTAEGQNVRNRHSGSDPLNELTNFEDMLKGHSG
ncbi:oxidoreductase [Corynebacterium diphtheriae]|nr:oxidoreductase [Corynebacterium diphtheriae]CAB1039321.1 oxidoreductase [Corynebacterium diphtheriae]